MGVMTMHLVAYLKCYIMIIPHAPAQVHPRLVYVGISVLAKH